MQESHCLAAVKEQYENYPYPYRNPEDEKTTLQLTALDPLCKINHYCFKGKRDFNDSFRVLVAGGGTGDNVIYLAEQLRNTDAKVVYLDISSASMEITKQRAEIRGLGNIEWLHGSLLDLPQMNLGSFDYINCCGVLHHLENPTEGLNALKNVLKKDGAMGIMVYGRYGRTGVYQMQELMRMINADEPDMQVKVENTKAALDCLPPTNWFKRAQHLFADVDKTDIDIFDCFLHSQDRAYTVLQLYEWVNGCSLNLIDFAECKAHYRPVVYVRDRELLCKIKEMPVKKQQAISELIAGALKKHSFYVSANADTIADPANLDNIPFFYQTISAKQLYDAAKDQPTGKTMEIKHLSDGDMRMVLGRYTKYLFKYLNGDTSLKKCFELIKEEKEFEQNKPSDEEIYPDFKKIYDLFNLMDMIVLRHQSVPVYPTFISYEQMQGPVTRKYQVI